MATNMTSDIVPRYSTFTTDDNLTLDSFIVFQDMDKAHSDMVDRYYVLKNKQYTTDAEKTEMTGLEVNLQEYLPTSDTWNKLCACILGMQMYMRDGIVVFTEQKKAEFEKIISNYSYQGEWTNTIIYSEGNLVLHNGQGFTSKVDNNLNYEPNSEVSTDDYWIRYTIKGDKGDPSLNVSIKKGTDGTANYDLLTTYNVGDACVYNHRLYYCLVDGTIGIAVTDNTKWACADKIWIGTDEPLDHFVIWWDINNGQNVLKRYSDNNVWVEQTVKAGDMIILDSANYFTSSNVEGALIELKIAINNIDLTASKVTVVDSANLYNGVNAETCLAEVMNKTNTAQNTANNATNLANTAQARADSAFTYANNGKTSVTGVVGNVSSSNTFGDIINEIQYDKNILASNLNNKGVSANNGDTLRNLASLVGNISLGRKHTTGTGTTVRYNNQNCIAINFIFTPSVGIFKFSQSTSNPTQNYYINGENIITGYGYATRTDSVYSSGTSIYIVAVGSGTYTYEIWE
jgi:hypothetical protein